MSEQPAYLTSGQRTSRMKTRRLTGAAVADSEREKDDFYATDPSATHALLLAEQFDSFIWEPACGDGAIVRVLEEHGYSVLGTDLVDRGHGVPRRDFLMERAAPKGFDSIVTNPPYKLADQFVRHALEVVGARKMALFLRLAFYSARRKIEGGAGLLDRYPPARVHALTWRAKTVRGGDFDIKPGLIDFAWFVWEREHTGPTELRRMRRPA